jgi:hypothetical protein
VGWWVAGATGRAKGQLRVLGSPSAPARTKDQGTQDRGGTGDRGAGSPRTRYFFAKAPWYIPAGTKAGLWAPRASSKVCQVIATSHSATSACGVHGARALRTTPTRGGVMGGLRV